MNLRLPLYGKILAWFFLNLLLVAGAFVLVVRLQLRGGVDTLLAGQAGERLRAIGQIILEELHERPRSEWNGILARFGTAHRAEFFLFDNDGPQLAGAPVTLPSEVASRVRPRGPQRQPPLEPDPNRRRPEGRAPPPPEPPPRPPADGPGEPWDRGRRPPPVKDTFFVRTTEPEFYWVGVRMGVPGQAQRPPVPATLLVRTPSLFSGGMFFDLTPWLAVGAGVLALSALFWFPLLRGITQSIRQTTAATGQIAEGQFDVRVPARRSDELGSLAGAVNRMAARLAGFVSGQKRFLGDIAHELCAPIARLQMALGILEQRADEKQKPYVADVREEVQQMSSLVNELLSFSKAGLRPRDMKLEPVNLVALARHVMEHEATDAATVEIQIPDEAHALAEPELLSRALANLLRNAFRYAGQSSPIRIFTETRGDEIILAVADSGPGVPDEALQQIFDPFFRIEASRSRDTGGAGLGLAIVKTCVEACGGKVSAKNLQPAGLQVELALHTAPGPQRPPAE
jgi:two-component system sensor histidine kinase CpxA